jgi:KDO2-lipid IV(A) lauroyltransferase
VTTPRFKHRCEYAAVKGLAGLLRLLPYRAALGLGWGLARLVHATARGRRNEARRRFRAVFGNRYPEPEVRRRIWLSWRNFVFSTIEAVRGDGADPAWTARHVSNLPGLRAHVRTLLDSGKGGIMATPHMGPWDTAGAVLRLLGAPMFSVAGVQKNPLVNTLINDLRSAAGVDIIPRDRNAPRRILRRIREGGVLAILPDVRSRTEALAIPFLGGTANIPAGMATFARKLDVPIYPTFPRRRGWTRLDIRVTAPVHPNPALDKQADLQQMTQTMFERIEAAIRDEPEQWFWFNKRWILEPLETRPTDNAGHAAPPADNRRPQGG